MTMEDMRAAAEQIRLNFVSGNAIFYDEGLLAWMTGQQCFIQHHLRTLGPMPLFEAVRILIWLMRARRAV